MSRLVELEKWLYVEYPKRLQHINRCNYLGIKPDETRYALEVEAYEKEQEIRKILGKKPLESLKNIQII